MALKFRGKTQIKDASLSLDKLAHSSQKRLVGNQLNSSGEPTTLTNDQSRNLMGLGTQDSAGFAGLTSATITSTQTDSNSDSLKSLGSLSVMDTSGTTTLSGDLDVQGTGNTAADLTVNAGGSFVVDSSGSADFNSGLDVTNSSLTTDTLSVTQSGAGSTTLTGHVDFDSSLTVDGLATMSGGILVNDSNITHSRDSAGVNVALTSPNVSLNSGNIDGVTIGSDSADEADFTSLIAGGDVTVNGNLTVQSGSVLSKLTSELEISDPLLLLAKDNSSADSIDMGIVGKYSSSASSSIVQNNTFDSDVSNWSDESSSDNVQSYPAGIGSVSVTYSFSRSHSTDFGSGALKLSVDRYPRTVSSMVWQNVAASQQTISYAFTNQSYTIKAKIYYNSSEVTSDARYRMTTLNKDSVDNYGKDVKHQYPTEGSTWYSLPSSGTEISLTVSGQNYITGASSGEMTVGFVLAHTGSVEYVVNASGQPDYPETTIVHFDDVKIYDANNNEVVNGSSSGYSGIVRDADGSGNFKLFSSSDSTIPSSQTVNFSTSSKSVLDADIEGDITYDTARNFSLTGDVISAPQAYYGSGNTVTMTASIQDNSIQVGNIDFLTDQDDMVYPGLENFASPTHIPTQQSVKAYVSNTIANSGFTGLQPRETKMVKTVLGGDLGFVSVEKVFFKKTCDSSDQGNDYVILSKYYEIDLLPKSEVYLNGQKLRYGSSYDYYFSEGNKLHLNNDILYSGDRIEVQYFVESSAVKINKHTGRYDVRQITSGWDHTLGLGQSGGVFVSGGNDYGQLGLGHTTSLGSGWKPLTYFDNNSITVRYLAGGKYFSLFVDSDEKVYSVGDGEYGKLGLNSTTDYTIPQEITYFSTNNIKVVRVYAGEYHAMALTDGGDLYGWGRNDKGQLGLGHTNQVLVPTALDMTDFSGNIADVDLGGLHSLVITDEKKSYTFGDNSYGQLGTGSSNSYEETPQLVNSNTVQGAAGGLHTLLLVPDSSGDTDDNGDYIDRNVIGSGDNRCGQLGAPLNLGQLNNNPLSSNTVSTMTLMPKPVDRSGNILKPLNVSAQGRHTSFITPVHGTDTRDYVTVNNSAVLCDTAGDQLDGCCGSNPSVSVGGHIDYPKLPVIEDVSTFGPSLDSGGDNIIVILGPPTGKPEDEEGQTIVAVGGVRQRNPSEQLPDPNTPIVPPSADEESPSDTGVTFAGGGSKTGGAGVGSSAGGGGC